MSMKPIMPSAVVRINRFRQVKSTKLKTMIPATMIVLYRKTCVHLRTEAGIDAKMAPNFSKMRRTSLLFDSMRDVD